MIITKNASVAPHGAARSGRVARAAAARQHGAGADRARQDGGRAGAAARRVLRPQRHVDAVLVPEGRRAAAGAAADAASLQRAQGSGAAAAAASPTKPANQVKGGGDHARSAGTFLTCVPFKFTAGADVVRRGDDGSDRRAGVRQGDPARRRSSSASNRTRCSAPATAARAAPTPTPSRGARRRRRCRSRTIRARCSSGCSAPAAAPTRRRGSRASSGTAAFSTSSAARSAGSRS